MRNTKQLISKLFGIVGVRLLAIALTFLQTLTLVKVFGADVFGQYSFVISIASILIVLLSMGVDQLMMRHLAQAGDGATGQPKWIAYKKITFRIVVPAVCSVVFFGLILAFKTQLIAEYKIPFVVMLCALPLLIARKYFESILLGLKKVLLSIVSSQVVFPLILISASGLVSVSTFPTSSLVLMLIYWSASALSLVMCIILCLPALKKLGLGATENSEASSIGYGEYCRSGLHLSFLSLGIIIGQHIDVLMMGVVGQPEDVALVRIAARMAEIVGLMRTIVLLQYRPMIASSFGQSDFRQLQRYTKIMVSLFLVGGLPIAIAMWIWSSSILLYFDPAFAGNDWVVRFYLLGILAMLIMGPTNAVLSMCDRESVASKNLLQSLGVKVILNLILMPFLGALGCAISSFVSLVFLGFLGRAGVRKALNLETSILVYFKNSDEKY